MSDVSASQVMALRQKTGVSMMACKKALTEANGDEVKALEILRKQGADKAASKSERTTAEGAIAISGNAIVSVSCETDFVARNENFLRFVENLAAEAAANGADAAREKFEAEKAEKITKLGENLTFGTARVLSAPVLGRYVHSNRKVGALVGCTGGDEQMATDIAMHVTAMNPEVTKPEEISAEAVEKEKEIWMEQLKKEAKPENIIEKILIGKEKKFREESALVKQPFVKDQEKTVEQYAEEHGGKVEGFVRVEV